jgi:hypothetical protein
MPQAARGGQCAGWSERARIHYSCDSTIVPNLSFTIANFSQNKNRNDNKIGQIKVSTACFSYGGRVSSPHFVTCTTAGRYDTSSGACALLLF